MTPIVVDGPLGRWTHSACRPSHLRGLVDEIWLFDGWLATRRERTFPNGLLEIFVHLGDRYRVVEDRGLEQDWVCPTLCLTGLQRSPVVVEAPARRTKVLGMKLTPAGAYALFVRPMCDLTGLTIDLHDLVDRGAAALADECHDAPSIDACLRSAVSWLDRRLAAQTRMDPAISWMIDQIYGSRGIVAIGALRERTGVSKTRLAAAFQEQVGVSPKQYARIVRFSRVLTRLHHEACGPLSVLALEAGYYDQPHMNAEFKELSGLTPGEFLAAQRFPNSVHVAE
jgi:AraC-like DNA-binding protein